MHRQSGVPDLMRNESRGLRVAGVSGHTKVTHLGTGVPEGSNSSLPKPIGPPRLQGKVREMLEAPQC
jgi:hypothetical protein